MILMLAVIAFADESLYYNGDDAGVVEGSISWEFVGSTSGGTLTITGTGKMKDFGSLGVPGVQPWGWGKIGIKLPITQVVIGEGITYIGRNALAGFSDVTKIVLPDSVEEIGESAFDGCSAEIVRDADSSTRGFPAGLKKIGYKAFNNNHAMTSVVLPEGLEYIDNQAFGGCTNLTHLELPSTLKTLMKNAFLNTPGLTNIVPAGNTTSNAITLPWGNGTEMPTSIGFGGSNVIRITFPSGITTVQGSVCRYMDYLEHITLSDTITKIGSHAFGDCKSLETVDFSGYTNLSSFGSYVFDNDAALRTVKLPAQLQITSDSYGTFSKCPKLTSVQLPDHMDCIPTDTFAGDSSLTEESFTWPSGVTSIQECAFEGSGIRKIEIPDTVQSLENRSFASCADLSEIHIPASVTSMEDRVFLDSHALLTAGPSDGSADYNIKFDWKETIPASAFSKAPITHAHLPEGLKTVPNSLFSTCDNLKVVVLPSTVETIDSYAFYKCPALTTVRMPENIRRIEDYAFSNAALKQLLFRGDAPSYIQRDAFSGDKITLYYPAGNKTYTRSLLNAGYTGNVKWKPYGTGLPEFASRERDAVLNYAGTVQARFYLVDTDGNVIPEAQFRYKRRANGKVEEFTNEYLVTDFDGGYDFQTPYLENEGTHEVEFFDFELVSKEDAALEDGLTFKINCEVTPLVYTEAWTFGLGKNGKIKFSKDSAFNMKISHSDGGKIELEHKKDGTEDLTLSLTMSAALQDSLSGKFSLPDTNPLSVELLSRSGSAKIEYTKTFSRKIENYRSDNASHQQLVATYMALVLLANNESLETSSISEFLGDTIDPFFSTAFSRVLSNLTELTFDQDGTSVKAKLSGSTTILTLTNTGLEPLSEDLKVGDLSGETAYSISVNNDESEDQTKKTYSSSVKSETFYALLSGSTMELVGVRGILGGIKINDAKASSTAADVPEADQEVSISHCNYDSGIQDVVGWNDVLQYHKFTAKGTDAVNLIGSSSYLQKLQKGSGLLLPSDYKDLAKQFQESSGTVTWKDTEKLANAYNLGIGFKVKNLLSIGISLNAEKEYNTEVQNGAYQNGSVYYIADSANAVKRAVNAESTTDLNEILAAPSDVLGDVFSDFIDDYKGTIGRIIEAGKALVSTDGVEDHDWNVHVYKVKNSSTKSAFAVKPSFRLMTLNAAGEPDDASAAATIGEAYHILCEDEGGNSVENLSEISPKLTISYTDEELAAAGYNAAEGSIGIYRMNRAKGGFEYIGGTVDSEAKTVTADISAPGEYVLGYNSAGPSVSGIRYSVKDKIIMADIEGFTAITSGQLEIDGKAVLTGDNFMKYLDRESGRFEWNGWTAANGNKAGDHTIVFTVTDEEGHEMRQEFTCSIKAVPVISEVIVPGFWYGQTITVKAKVTSASADEDLKVWADIVIDGDSSKRDTVMMLKEGEYWYLKYLTEPAMNKYTFYIYASDDNGVSASVSKVSSLSLYATETVNGITYEINKASGLIMATNQSQLTGIQELVIPAQIDGAVVRGIGGDAFRNNETLERIVCPESLEYISAETFSGCTTLKEVVLNDGLIEIGKEAFLNCVNLLQVAVPSSVTVIGEHALGFERPEYYGDYESIAGFAIEAEEGSAAAEYYKQMEGETPPDDPGECEHEFDWYYEEEPTCISGGVKVYVCEKCGYTYKENVGPDEVYGHSWSSNGLVEIPTPERPGAIQYICRYCGKTRTINDVYWMEPQIIFSSARDFVYNGKVQEPDFYLLINGYYVSPDHYTVTHPQGKNVGKHTVKITLNNSGYVSSFSYTIKPKGTAISKVTAKKKAATVKWKKQAKQIDGYQIQYALNSKFTKGKKLIKIKGTKKVSTVIKKLKSKKKYYIRIRTYKKAGGVMYYSSWSKAKKVKVK